MEQKRITDNKQVHVMEEKVTFMTNVFIVSDITGMAYEAIMQPDSSKQNVASN